MNVPVRTDLASSKERRVEQGLDMSGLCRIFGNSKSRNRDKMRILSKIRAKKSRPSRGGRSAFQKKRKVNYFSSLTSGVGAEGEFVITSGVGAEGRFLNFGSERSEGAFESLVQQKEQELDNKAVVAKASSVNVRVMVVVVFWLLKKWGRITG